MAVTCKDLKIGMKVEIISGGYLDIGTQLIVYAIHGDYAEFRGLTTITSKYNTTYNTDQGINFAEYGGMSDIEIYKEEPAIELKPQSRLSLIDI